MRSIPFLDDHYPVRTLVSDNADWQGRPGWARRDDREVILRDYLRVPVRRVVYARETHSGSVLAAEENDASLAAVEESFILGSPGGYDAMVTSVPGVLLCVWTSDCIPLLLYNAAKHAAGVAHCGWRGICSGIAANTLEVMGRRFGSSPEDILAFFGPGICGNCYDVDGDLIGAFSGLFSPEEIEALFRPREDGKYLLDLRKAIAFELLRAGLRPDRIRDEGICSYESMDFASYRRARSSEASRQTLSGIVLL